MKKLLTLCFLLAILFNAKAQDLIRFDFEGWTGFKNKQGEVVIKADYKYPADFHDGLLCAIIDDKFGYVDITGKIEIPFIFERATTFYKGFAAVQLNKNLSIINKKGKEVKKLKYNYLGKSKDDFVVVGLDEKYGTMDKSTGKELIPPIYSNMSRFYKNLQS